MNFGKAFAKIFYKEASKVIDQRVRQRAKEQHIEKIHAEYAEKNRQNEIIRKEKVRFLQEKIDIAEDYLRNKVDILGIVEKKKKLIQSWFYQNHWLKTVDERKVAANYSGIKITPAQRKELLRRLDLKKSQYVQHGVLSDLTENSTLEFIVEHTPVVEELRQKQALEGYSLYIASHYNDYSRRELNLCFGLVIKDNAKQPF
ncbi:hypothetical protein J7E79_07420 [Bacillus sp. ISL-40]|uniref:hypothetical protein n=1 Tax=unclassified Bacillus (in: firmicutes) TaxID=185979 RepID=UPI001BE7FCBA|nr:MULTISPECIES: hypothetical protein [unclassified Bacillus (in: firmicutes)]MBT2697239.1 hypothetical protein [Bacillus sp. ISL-40]MBT2741192.1 hypothetical protein [Bacillus sp. ISL-77]